MKKVISFLKRDEVFFTLLMVIAMTYAFFRMRSYYFNVSSNPNAEINTPLERNSKN